MQPVECEFEAEVLSAVLQSRWPERADPALQAHVADCTICSDVAAGAGVIEDAREEMRAEVVVPDSGRVWWLARVRARQEAAKTAARPITATQMIAGACAVARWSSLSVSNAAGAAALGGFGIGGVLVISNSLI